MEFAGIELAAKQNDLSIRRLVEQLRSPIGVIPFIGAGLSKGLNLFPEWGEALRELAQRTGAAEAASVETLLKQEQYERAAAVIADALGDEEFQRSIAAKFGDHLLKNADLSAGPVAILPFLAGGPVITTNFDRVVERAFARAGRPFDEGIIKGPNPDEVVPALQQNRFVLWKIHGDWQDRRMRVFTEKEYKRIYRDLEHLLWLALTNRPALFIGCSLVQDRVVAVLEKIQRAHKGIAHFAILQAPAREEEFRAREKTLRRAGIVPLWYPEGRHERIQSLLGQVLDGMSSYRLGARRARDESEARSPAEPYRVARRVLELELRDLAEGVDAGWAEEAGQETPGYTSLIDRIAKGRMAFFLGAGACMGRLPLGRAFYEDLARRLGSDAAGLHPVDIAQHFTDLNDRDALYTQVGDIINRVPPQPTAIHWFLATLRQRLLEKGYGPAPLMILTTNNDNWMEWALDQAGEKYHLFTFRREEPCRGCFVYCTPQGEVRAVDRPAAFRRLEDESTVVVKYHGGFHPELSLPPSYVFTSRDFVELAGRVPEAIPQVLLDRLGDMGMLFIGHGLGDVSIEGLVRVLKGRRPDWMSWAVQWPPNPARQTYWKAIGVRIVHLLQERFIVELDQRLEDFPKALHAAQA